MKMKKLISLCLTLALLASLMCLPAAAAEVSDWDALSAALEKGGAVKLSADVTAPAERERILEVPAGVTATLDLNGFTLDGGTPGEEDCVILVRGSFTLTDSSADGAGRITGTRDAVDAIGGDFTLAGGTLDACGNYGVAAAEGSSFTMTGGAVRGSGQIGVLVTGEGSIATVSGGEISGSVGYYEDGWFYNGTGLQVDNGASAEIVGGVISDNVFGVKSIEATLTLSGGEVRDSFEMPLSDDLTYGGAGLYVYQGRIRMSGGTVSGNTWAGLYTDVGSEVEVSGGTIIGDGEYAVQILDGEVFLTGGLVTGGNEAAVLVSNGALSISGGEISGSPKSGVWRTGGRPSMTDGIMSDNEWFRSHLAAGSFDLSGGALSGNGFCGIMLVNAETDFHMSGGTISGSRGYWDPDAGEFYFGAGVEVIGGSVSITSGEIFDNDGGIEIRAGSVEMSGGEIRNSRFVCTSPDGEISYGGLGVGIGGGTFKMTGGTLRDNEAWAILVTQEGSAAVSGGTISGNGSGTLPDGGGGLLFEDGTLALSGSPVFSDNGTADLALAPGMTLTVAGPLALDKPLVVGSYELGQTHGNEVVITTGLPGNGGAESFVYASPTYEIAAGADGEAKAVYVRWFPDVKNTDWYASGVAYAASKGIFEGTDKGFEPKLSMTNAMAVQALWNHAGKPVGDAELPYGDAAADAWYSDALRWAVTIGVADAEKADFAPNEPITRERFALLCYRYMQTLGEGFDGLWSFHLDFPDTDAISADSLESVSWCVMNEIIIGMGNGNLAPQGILTRAQAATVLMRLFNRFG